MPREDGENDGWPVHDITYEQAQEFCKRLGQNIGGAYALPTRAEWLAAAGLSEEEAEGETAWRKLKDAGALERQVTSLANRIRGPAMVGSLASRPDEICDLFGNVREWVEGGTCVGFSYNSQAGRTRELMLDPSVGQWVTQETGFRCWLHGLD